MYKVQLLSQEYSDGLTLALLSPFIFLPLIPSIQTPIPLTSDTLGSFLNFSHLNIENILILCLWFYAYCFIHLFLYFVNFCSSYKFDSKCSLILCPGLLGRVSKYYFNLWPYSTLYTLVIQNLYFNGKVVRVLIISTMSRLRQVSEIYPSLYFCYQTLLPCTQSFDIRVNDP